MKMIIDISRVGSLGVLVALMLASASGCGDDDDANNPTSDASTADGTVADTSTSDANPPDTGTPDAEPQEPVDPLYVAHFTQQTPDAFNSLVGIVSDLSAGTQFDVTGALTFPGFLGVVTPPTPNGSFFVMLGDETVIIRYDISETGELVEFDPRLNYSSLGATRGNFMLSFAHFISEDRAYMVVPDALSVLVWNPQTMTIVESIDLSSGLTPPDNLRTRTTDSRIDAQGRLLVPMGYCRFMNDDNTCAPLMRVAIIDPTDFSVTYDEDTRCGRPTLSVTDASGAIYFISHPGQSSQFVGGAAGDPAFPGCLIRVQAGADGFDPNYYVNQLDLTPEGRPIGSIIPGVGNRAYATVWPRSPDEFDAANWFELRSEPVWQVFSFEPGNEAATFALESGIPTTADQISGRLVSVRRPSGEDELIPVALTNPDGFDSTTFNDVSDPNNWAPGIVFPGFAYSVNRAR
ncbi:MAG: hypothetical protein AAGF12_32140 [Myxococcota bacterium]